MWNPKSLKIVGIASYYEAEYVFTNGIARLIQGINQYDKGQKSNGAGKSILLEGLSIVFTGEPLRKIRLAEMIDFEAHNEHSVEFEMENSISNKNVVIKREFFEKKSPKITIIEDHNWESPIKKSGSTEYTRYILDDLIGISKEDLFNYFIIQKDNFSSFLSVTDSKQKLTIHRFSGSNLINGVEEDFSTEITKIEADIKTVEVAKTKLEGNLEVYEESVIKLDNYKEEQAKKDFIVNKDELIMNNATQINIKQGTIDSLNQELPDKVYNLQIYQVRLAKFVNVYTDDLKEIIETKNEAKELKGIIEKDKLEDDTNKKETEGAIAELEKVLLGKIECPKCHHLFFAEGDLCSYTPESANLALIKEEKQLKEINEAIEILLKDIEVIEEEYNESVKLEGIINNKIAQYNRVKNSLINRIKEVKFGIETNNTTLIRLDKEIKELKKYKLELNKSEFKSKFVENAQAKKILLESIKDCNTQIKEYNKSIELKKKEIGKQEKYKVLYTKFKTHLANKAIKSIEGFTNYYLEKFGSDMSLLIDGYKLLADNKTVREEISVKVLGRNGERVFGSFSNGEKTRGVIANILSLQKLINLSSHSGGFNLLVLDEIIESVDLEGLVSVMFCLEKLGQNIEVITLNQFPNIYPHVVGVHKAENGFSNFEFDKTKVNALLETIN